MYFMKGMKGMNVRKEFDFLEKTTHFTHVDESNPDYVSYYFSPCDDNGEVEVGEWLFYIDIPRFFSKTGIVVTESHITQANWFESLALQAENTYRELYRLRFLFE